MFHKKTARDVMHEQAHCHDEAASHQLPIAAAFWIIRIVSTEACSSLMKNFMQIHCSTCSVILNVTATQNTCSLNSICHPHWLVQWSHHCSCMCIPVHSPWLPGHINVMQTILIILTNAEVWGCYRLTDCVPLKVYTLKPNPQCESSRRWEIWKVITSSRRIPHRWI